MTWWAGCHIDFWKFHPHSNFISSGHFHGNCLLPKQLLYQGIDKLTPPSAATMQMGLDKIGFRYSIPQSWQHAYICLILWTGNAHTSKLSLAWLFSSAGHPVDITQDAWVLSARMNYRYLCYQLRNPSIQSWPISQVSSKLSLKELCWLIHWGFLRPID